MLPEYVETPADLNSLSRKELASYAHISIQYELGNYRYYNDQKTEEWLNRPVELGGPIESLLMKLVTASQEIIREVVRIFCFDSSGGPDLAEQLEYDQYIDIG